MRSRKLRWVLWSLAGLAALAVVARVAMLWPRVDGLTPENVGRIQFGMSPAEVEAILGPPNSSFLEIRELLAADELSMKDVATDFGGSAAIFRTVGDTGSIPWQFWLGSTAAVGVGFVHGQVVIKERIP